MKDHSRNVSMHCSTCGGTDFEYDKEVENGPIRCVGCDRVFTREELIRENGEHIEANVEEVKKDILRDVEADLKNMFKGFR